MRNRTWVWITVVVILAVVAVGIGAAALVAPTNDASSTPSLLPSASPSGSSPVMSGAFEMRQVLFQESGRTQGKPPLRPGPAEGGTNAVRDLLRVDCSLKPRPMTDKDNVILCDYNGIRYGLGPSELPPSPVASAQPQEGLNGDWVVSVALTDAATPAFQHLTERVSPLHPPLNQVAVVIGGIVVTAPQIQEPIKGNQIQITGPFTQQDAQTLADSAVR